MNRDKTILLVEDEAFISSKLMQSLIKFGYTAVSVNSGEGAIKICSENEAVSLILMDIDLGEGIGGAETAKEIQKYRNIPVIFLTAHEGQQMVERVQGIIHYGYVIKSSKDFVLKSSIDMAFELFKASDRAKINEKNYHEIFDSSSDALFIHDMLNGAILDVNKKMLNMYGYKDKNELLNGKNKDLWVVDKDNIQESGESLIQTYFESGKKSCEMIARRKNGDTFWAEIFLSSVKIEGVDRILASVRDISKRKRFEKNHIESEARFKSIIELAPDAILFGTSEGIVTGVNERACELTGYARDEFAGKNIKFLFSEEESIRVPLRYDLLKQGLTVYNERYLVKKDGSVIFIGMNTKMMPDGTYQAFIRDISERKLYEDNLAAERERLSVTLRSIGDGVITTDDKCSIVIMNRVAEELTGWSVNDVDGIPFNTVFNIIDESTRMQCENPAFKVIKNGISTEAENHTILLSKNGTERVISHNGAQIRDNNNNVIGAVIVFRDMTEKIKLLDAVQQTDRLNSLGVLAGGIAHDFNNLLSGIFGYIEIARLKCSSDEKVLQYLDKAFDIFNRGRELTQQLLTFSKGGVPVRKTGNIGMLVNDIAALALSGSDISCEFFIEKNLSQCDYDKNQIAQVIDNIIVNAIQAMPAGGKITIKGENVNFNHNANPLLKKGDYVKLSISDTGTGIHPDHLKRIFDPFFTTRQQGNGLGLATCYSIIKKHDGLIEAESVPGRGSVFHIYLPASSGEISENQKPAIYSQRVPGKILIMDDEEFIREISGEMLALAGYTTIDASNGEEALKLIESAAEKGEPFDGAILDLTIPGGMGGKDTLVEIRKKYPSMPVYASSGFSEDPVISRPEDFGFNGSISKPYRQEQLVRLLNGGESK